MSLTALFLIASINLDLPPDLLKSICTVESGLNTKAYKPKDGKSPSYGVCQIKEATARFVGFKGTKQQLMKPEVNIYYAGKYLKYQHNRYHDWTRAICAFNKGSSTSSGLSPYLGKVLNAYFGRKEEEFAFGARWGHRAF